MPQNLYIGDLAWSTTNESLKDFFEKIGKVESAFVVVDHSPCKA